MVNDVWQMTIRQTLNGQEVDNVLHFQEGAAAILADGLAQSFIDTILPQWRTLVSNQHQFDKLSIRKLNPIPLDPQEYALNAVKGTLAQEPLPGQCAVVASIRTGQGGRSKRGRIYFGGITPDTETGGIITPAQQAAWTTFLDLLRSTYPDNVGPSGWILGVYSRKNGYIPPNYSTAAFTPAKQIVLNVRLGTQRRRSLLG